MVKELLSTLLVNRRSLQDLTIAKRTSILLLMHAAASDPTVAEVLRTDEDRHALQLMNRNMNMPDILLVGAGGQQVVDRVRPSGAVSREGDV